MRRVLALAMGICLFGGASATAAAPVTLHIVFPEGFTVRKMADQISAVRLLAIHKRHVTPVLTGSGFAAAAAATRTPAGFAKDDRRKSIEGFLFPATYTFFPATTPAQLISDQLLSFTYAWRTLSLGAARARGVTPYGVLTIASMVEREAVVPAERKLIAAVIYNRLAKGMPLGIDATLRYGLGIQGTKALTETDLRNQTPYNTSIHKGLPPTPIGNPGLASLQAAARPAAVGYLYYLRRPDHRHHFFTASEQEFCQKAVEFGYHPC